VNKLTRENICNELKEKLLYLEKYATTKDGNKITYVIIPNDHPVYPFPYNLEDRIKDRINQINKLAERKVDILVKKSDKKYTLTFNNDKFLHDLEKKLKELGCKLENKEWVLVLE
jgi:hypothetical protein